MDTADRARFGPNSEMVERFLRHIAGAPTLCWLDAVKSWSDTDATQAALAVRALSEALEESRLEGPATRLARRVRECADAVEWTDHYISPEVRRELIERATTVATQTARAIMVWGVWLESEYVRTLHAPWGRFVPWEALERDG